MNALYELLKPERLTAIVETGVDKDEAPPYQRMMDEGLCTVRVYDAAVVGPVDLLKVTGPNHGENLWVGHGKVAVHTSTSFWPVNTFNKIDADLRERGFLLHCFADCVLTTIPTHTAIPHQDPHQLSLADIFYVRDFAKDMAHEQWKHLAMIAHHVCGSFDLAMLAVSKLAVEGEIDKDAPAAYRKILEAI